MNRLITTALLVAIAPLSEAGVTVTAPANHIPTSTCPAGDGSNKLKPDPVTQLPPPAAGSGIMNELANGDSNFPGWTFATGGNLNGTIKIKKYQSKFKATHHSGCVMSLEYIRGAGDPANLQFIQMITTNAPLNGASSPYIDPYPNDDPIPAPMPFYYTAAEMPGQTTPNGIKFYDFPSRKHPPTSTKTWTGDLYLASWDGAKGVKLHDGIRYGFKAGCTTPSHCSVAVGVTQAVTALSPNDILYVNPVHIIEASVESIPPIPLANDATLIGARLFTQAWLFDDHDLADPLKMSNPLDITIGGAVHSYAPGSGLYQFLYGNPVPGGAIDIRVIFEAAHESHTHEGDTDGKEEDPEGEDEEDQGAE